MNRNARRQCVRGVFTSGSRRGVRGCDAHAPDWSGEDVHWAVGSVRSSWILLRTGRPPNRYRQIIYALPYTSIIEQTRELFEDPGVMGRRPREVRRLTVHHYLSETIVVHHDDYDAGDTAATDDEETASMLGEAWRDGTVLTTFK